MEYKIEPQLKEVMDLPLNNVLNLTKEEIENSKIEFNMQAGSGGQPFLDRWLKHSGYSALQE